MEISLNSLRTLDNKYNKPDQTNQRIKMSNE